MPVFNVAFMGTPSKGTGGSGYGILVDQLSILENELSKDGFLSPGDYDQLIKAGKSMMGAGLTADQRSNIMVKISDYQSKKSVSSINNDTDIDVMLRTLKNEQAEDVHNVGNDPLAFMQGRNDSLESMISDLANSIQQKAESGQDYSKYLNQYEESVNDLKARKDILNEMKSKQPGDTAPIKGAAAYVTTNRKGEIVDVDYSRYDNRGGYAETNATINGVPVFGKINYKDNGSNYFVLGGKTFSAADITTPDPANPGSFQVKKLVADVTGGLVKKGSAVPLNFTSQDLTVQNYVPIGGWAKGIDGSFYKRDTDGKFKKYINGDVTKLGISDNDMITIPKVMESTLMGNSVETIDANNMIMPEQSAPQNGAGPAYDPFNQGNPFSSMFGQGQMNAKDYSSPSNPTPSADQMPLPMSSKSNPTPSASMPAPARTSSPTERAPSTFWGTAQNTMNAGVNYFQNLFK